MKMNTTIKKKLFRWKYKLAAVIIAFLIFALFLSWFNRKQKPDPASEKNIRMMAAKLLGGNPEDLTDEDFSQITKFRVGDTPTLFGASSSQRFNTNQLSDVKLLEKFINLEALHFMFINYPEKDVPKWMKILAKTGFLDLDKRFGLDLSPLEKLPNLRELALLVTPVKSIKPLADFKSLRILELNTTNISDLKPIKGMVNLQKLRVPGSKVSSLEPLKGLINLQELDIKATKISDLKPIKGLTNLKILNIQGCKNITDEQVEDLQKALPELRITR